MRGDLGEVGWASVQYYEIVLLCLNFSIPNQDIKDKNRGGWVARSVKDLSTAQVMILGS